MAKLSKLWRKLPTLGAALKKGRKHPPVGITQGGSSRKHPGAKPAAFEADAQKKQRKR
jgi:hypothetical protein